MFKISTFLLCSFITSIALADNVILMIGDGMGANHLQCSAEGKPLYLTALPTKGWVQTRSANNIVTDSAASATAYSCGQKTNNYFLGKLPDKTDCFTIAEEAVEKGYGVGIYSTDHPTGATPSAFYAHTTNRHDKKTIEQDKKKATQSMDIAVPVKKISSEITPRLTKLSAGQGKKGFFAMFEGAKIDTESHKNNFEAMKKELYDFDYAVMKASNYVQEHPDTTLIVLADHETGGLTDDCRYTSKNHTVVDIPLHAYGKHAKLFEGVQDNTEIYHKIKSILFSENE